MLGASTTTGPVGKRFPLPKGAVPLQPKQLEAPAPSPKEKRDRIRALLESDRLSFLDIRQRFERTGRQDPELLEQQTAIEDGLVNHVRELQALGPAESGAETPTPWEDDFVAVQTPGGVTIGYMLPALEGLRAAA